MDEARRRRRTSKFRLMPWTSNKEEGYFCRSLDKVEGSFVRIPQFYARCLSHRKGFSSFVFFFSSRPNILTLWVASRPRRISSFPFLLFPRGQTANLSSSPSSFSCERGEPPFLFGKKVYYVRVCFQNIYFILSLLSPLPLPFSFRPPSNSGGGGKSQRQQRLFLLLPLLKLVGEASSGHAKKSLLFSLFRFFSLPLFFSLSAAIDSRLGFFCTQGPKEEMKEKKELSSAGLGQFPQKKKTFLRKGHEK